MDTKNTSDVISNELTVVDQNAHELAFSDSQYGAILEELNRRIADHLSDTSAVLSESAYKERKKDRVALRKIGKNIDDFRKTVVKKMTDKLVTQCKELSSLAFDAADVQDKLIKEYEKRKADAIQAFESSFAEGVVAQAPKIEYVTLAGKSEDIAKVIEYAKSLGCKEVKKQE